MNFATGDGLILAKKIGANLKGMSTVMVHPWSINNGRSILVGEIVSLCKGKIVDEDGNQLLKDKTIMKAISENDYHESFEELLRFEFDLLKKNKDIYLDMSHVDENFLKKKLREFGFNSRIVNGRRIKVSPTVHYTSGGIEVSQYGCAVGVNNLYVIGEAQFDGNRGIGRLPGQPLISAIVFGKVISDEISRKGNFIVPTNNINCPLPLLIRKLYSHEINSYTLEAWYEELGEILMEIISPHPINNNLLIYKERIQHIQDSIMQNAKGQGKDFQRILTLYYGCCIASEIIIAQEEKYSVQV